MHYDFIQTVTLFEQLKNFLAVVLWVSHWNCPFSMSGRDKEIWHIRYDI
jgi:hypothetical protein